MYVPMYVSVLYCTIHRSQVICSSFCWQQSEWPETLVLIRFCFIYSGLHNMYTIQDNSFLAVVGKVASGKVSC